MGEPSLQTREPVRGTLRGQRRPPPAWITYQDLISFLYLFPVRGLARLLPMNALIWLADFLTPLYLRLRHNRIQWTSNRMANIFKGRELQESPDDMARSYAARDLRKGIDDLILRRINIDTLKERATVGGTEHLDAALAEGKGVILVSGHFHANRLGKYYLRRIGYPVMSIRNRKPWSTATGRFGKRYLVSVYGRFLDKIVEDEVYAQDAARGAKVLKRLRENGIVNVHIDAAISSEWFWVPFLNEERPFAGGFIRIAELTGTPLVPMQCVGNTSEFKINFGEPIHFEGKSLPEDFIGRMMSMVALLESFVLEHPTQWELWTRLRKRHQQRMESPPER